MTMKRSFDSSFVTDLNSATTSRTHSFHRRCAPLAAHPFYIPEDYNSPSLAQEQPLLTPTRYILADFEGDAEFQSNVWFQPTPNDTHHWSRLNPPGRRSLTGLGITFNHTEDRDTVPYLLSSAPVLAPFSQPPGPLAQARPRQPLPFQTRTPQEPCPEDPIESSADETGQTQTAYSACPSDDFAARSSVLPAADDFLMFIDSPDVPCMDEFRTFLDAAMHSPAGPVVGLFPDVNYRTLEAQKNSPAVGVNPEDITGNACPPFTIAEGEDQENNMNVETDPVMPSVSMREGSPDVEADFPEEALSAIVSILAESVKQEKSPQEVLPASTSTLYRHLFPAGTGLPMQPPAFASRTASNTRIPVSSSRNFTTPILRSPLAPLPPRNLAENSSGPVQRPSPVLNAHEGVELHDLRSRAESFRQMNPGYELDKAFLQAFAGRLSERGELIPEFRCYVKGCSQTNKRRDHVLVHVGSHVEHRPFRCDEW